MTIPALSYRAGTLSLRTRTLMRTCTGLFGFLFGHAYQARYDERRMLPPAVADMLKVFLRRSTVVNSMKIDKPVNDMDRLYVADVCTRCGGVVERIAPLPGWAETAAWLKQPGTPPAPEGR